MVRVKFSFKKENESYTIKKKGVQLPRLVQIYWDITYKCPCKCEHCYAKPLRKIGKELGTSEVKNVIDYLAANDIPLITFTGGEPLEREDIFDILEHAKRKNIHVSLITSGIYPNKIKELSDAGVKRIQFSLDHSNAEVYDSMRGMPGLYKNLLDSINSAINSGIRTSISTTITRTNYSDISNIFSKAIELDVDELRLMRLMPCGIAQSSYEKLAITFEEYKNLIAQLVGLYLNLKEPIMIDIEEPYTLIEGFKGTPAEKYIYYRGCLQGEAVCALTADGKILPCPIGNYDSFVCGDVRKDDLLKVWKESSVFGHFRDYKSIKVCASCEFGGLCKGGCRCAAFGYYGKIDAPDPICPKAQEYMV